MSQRASFPQEAVTVTPGYSWRLDLDLKFDGERPADWPDWTIRMHFWDGAGPRLTLTNGSGVTFEEADDLPGATAPVVIPVIRLSEAQTASFSRSTAISYLVDVAAPGADAEDLFHGHVTVAISPPAEMLQ